MFGKRPAGMLYKIKVLEQIRIRFVLAELMTKELIFINSFAQVLVRKLLGKHGRLATRKLECWSISETQAVSYVTHN